MSRASLTTGLRPSTVRETPPADVAGYIESPTIRVLTYNVRHGQGFAGVPANRRVARVVSRIVPTVVGLQEVWRAGSFYDQPSLLGALTGMGAHYHSTHKTLAGETGNLLLTAHTVHSTERLDLGGRRESRGCMIADIEAAGARFYFAVTHLSLHAKTRTAQLETLAERLPSDRPLVIVGDFNCRYDGLGPLSRRLAFTEDPPLTYPSLVPFRALDHIGYSEHWELTTLLALPSLASDHRPVVGELRLR